MSGSNKYKLNEIKKTEIFSVPDSYFENFDDKLFEKIDLNEEENKEFDLPESYFEEVNIKILSKISDNNEFAVPDNYFWKFENKLFEKLDTENKEDEVKVFSLSKKLKQITYIVSSAAAIIVLGLIINNKYNYKPEFNTLIDNNALYLSDQELYSLLSDEEIEVNAISFNYDFSEDEVLDYLSNSNLENVDLINE